jgi:hypothetical protein
MLREGRVARQGPIRELTTSDAGSYAVAVRGDAERFRAELREAGAEEAGAKEILVRLPAGGDTTVIFRAAVAASVQVRVLRPVRRTLEDVFLDAVRDGDAD